MARKSPQRRKGRRISGVEMDEEEAGEAGRMENCLPMKIK